MNGTETSLSVYPGAIPRPANSAATGRNSLGGRMSVGGVSSPSGSRNRRPHAFVTAFALRRGTLSTGTHPSIHDTAP